MTLDSNCRTEMRIALFANGLYPYRVGGMQKHTTCLARYLPNTGTQVDVYYIADQKHPASEIVHKELFDSNNDVRVHAVDAPAFPHFPGHYYLTCLWQSYWLHRALRGAGVVYDFIFAQGYTGWYAMLARKRRPMSLPPIGVHGHGLEALQEPANVWWYIKNCFAPVWQKWNIRLADSNLSLGGQLDDILAQAGARRSGILPAYNGIDSEWFRQTSEIREVDNNVRFLFVGRDSARKGIAELNEAIGRLKDEPRFEIHLAGNIAPSRRISARNVVYHNEVRDEQELRALYRDCDVLVCPSYSEGMPTVILEAMASGLAVIATDVGAVKLLVDATTGWLIPPKNSAALLDAMRSAMLEPIRARKLAGRKRVEGFAWEGVVRLFVDQLNAFLALPQKRVRD